MKKYLPYLSGIIMSLIFGFSFMFSKNALDSLGAFELLFLRFFTASLTMTILIIFKLIRVDYKDKDVRGILLLALWQPIAYFILETYGLKFSTSSEVGIMMAFLPVLTTILASVFLKEKTAKIQILFILISVIGVIFIVVMGGSLKSSGELKGTIYVMGAVLSGGIFNILSRKESKNFTPVEITYFMMLIGTIAFGLIVVVTGLNNNEISLFTKITPKAITSILYLGVMSSVVAFMLINYTLSKLPASQSSIFANLTTVVSIIAGVAIRHETFESYKIIGGIIIIIGVWGTNYFSKESLQS